MTALRDVVEVHGMEPVLEAERHGSARSQAWLWAAANANPFVIAYGFFVMGYGVNWLWAMLVIVAGCVVGYGLLGCVALRGSRSGQPTMALSQLLFGRLGNLFPTVASYVALVGWGAVNLVLAVFAAESLIVHICGEQTTLTQVGSFASVTLIVLLVAFFGYQLLMSLQRIIACAAVGAITMYALLTAHNLHLPDPGKRPELASITGASIFVLVAGGLAWVIVGADYSRYLPSDTRASQVLGWTSVGGGLPSAVLMVYGVMLCASQPELATQFGHDPVGVLANVAPPWFAVIFLAVTVVGFTSNAAINLYSSSLNLLALGVKVHRPISALINGILMVLASAYVVFRSPEFYVTFESFLDILGVPIAAWCAVFLWEFIRRNDHPAPVSNHCALRNTLIVISASTVGFGLITSQDPMVAHAVGWLMSEQMRQSSWGVAKLGVPAAFILAAVMTYLFSRKSKETLA